MIMPALVLSLAAALSGCKKKEPSPIAAQPSAAPVPPQAPVRAQPSAQKPAVVKFKGTPKAGEVIRDPEDTED
jgi:hypothetical protein